MKHDYFSTLDQSKFLVYGVVVADLSLMLKPGFHIVSVVSVVRKKFIGQIQLYGNLPYNCSIQQKRQIQLVVRDRMNSICAMNFFVRQIRQIQRYGNQALNSLLSNDNGSVHVNENVASA